MTNSRRSSYVFLGLSVLGVGLLLLLVLQVHGVEKRVATQSQQLRAMGEATERLAGQLDRLTKGGGMVAGASQGQDANYAHVKLLHPEVENFLKPKDLRWPAPEAKDGGTLRREWSSGDPKNLNPLISSGAEVQELFNYVGSGLAAQNSHSNPDTWYGDIAWRVEVTDDSKEYTIYLKEGVLWHLPCCIDLNDPKHAWLKEKREVTAHDFVFALDMILNPQVENGSLKNYYADIESYKAVDDHTLVVRWKESLYQAVTFTLGLGPLPRHVYARNQDGSEIPKETVGLQFNQHWFNNKGIVDAGPYRMEAYEPGVQIRLVRNEDYHGDKPAIAEIVFPIYTDQNQTVLKLKSKELSAGYLTPSQYRQQVLQFKDKPKAKWPKDNPFLNGDIQCDELDAPAYRYIGWNADRSLFSDRRVRRAMTHSLNREDLIKEVFVNLGTIAVGPILPSSPFADPTIKPLPFDLTKAKALLAEAGWSDSDGDGLLDRVAASGKKETFEFGLLIVAGSQEYQTLASVFKEDLLKIGVKLNIESVEWSLMLKRVEDRNFDSVLLGWALTWTVDPYQIWHSSQADVPKGSNSVGFRNKEADKLIEDLRRTFDVDERIKKLRRFHQIVHEEQPYTFVIVPKRPFCHWKEVKGVRFSKTRPLDNSLPWWLDP